MLETTLKTESKDKVLATKAIRRKAKIRKDKSVSAKATHRKLIREPILSIEKILRNPVLKIRAEEAEKLSEQAQKEKGI